MLRNARIAALMMISSTQLRHRAFSRPTTQRPLGHLSIIANWEVTAVIRLRASASWSPGLADAELGMVCWGPSSPRAAPLTTSFTTSRPGALFDRLASSPLCLLCSCFSLQLSVSPSLFLVGRPRPSPRLSVVLRTILGPISIREQAFRLPVLILDTF
ncbi:hypothetical protein BV20DRAFT_171722 [Pilatotrama ljubarskyi]|nr:hypothetical protein BV20DRAFT_171722 [Pilatotrama ljubarskyi]